MNRYDFSWRKLLYFFNALLCFSQSQTAACFEPGFGSNMKLRKSFKFKLKSLNAAALYLANRNFGSAVGKVNC